MAAVALATTAACTHAGAGASDDRIFAGTPLAPNVTCGDARCSSYNVQPYVRTRSRYGIGCMGNVPPGTTIPPTLPPESYAVRDIGKPGFPALKRSEAAMVAAIARYVHSKTLRIAWVNNTTMPNAREFIVFNATDGPCEVWAGGYAVLNGGCNEFYQPGENPYNTHAGSGCYDTTPKRPWMRDSR